MWRKKHVKYTSGLAKNTDFGGPLLLTSSYCPLATSELPESPKPSNYLLKISGKIFIFLTLLFPFFNYAPFFLHKQRQFVSLKNKTKSICSLYKSSPFSSKILLVSFQFVTQSPGTWGKGGPAVRDIPCKSESGGLVLPGQGGVSVTFKFGEGRRKKKF